MPRIIVAPDSFKESMSAVEAADRIEIGIRGVLPLAEIIKVPLSDGGEGLVDTLVTATDGRLYQKEVTGPLGGPVTAVFGVLGDGETGVVEMAAASGLVLVPPERRNPMYTTTYGTGELIGAALERGCRRLIVGVGGSATHDGGAGMAEALGVRLLDRDGGMISRGAAGLLELVHIDFDGRDKRIDKVDIVAATDVSNPLCGAGGAAYVYAPQKGASPDMLPVLDRALYNLASVVKRDTGLDISALEGAGAAGGMGAGIAAFLGGRLRRGIASVFEVLKFEEVLAAGADLVVTGEGEINGQTVYGKVPAGVARVAKKYNVPVLVLAGSIGPGAEKVYEEGIGAFVSIISRPMSLQEAVLRGPELLSEAAGRAVRVIMLARQRAQTPW